MIYVYWYFGLGIVVLLVLIIISKILRKRELSSSKSRSKQTIRKNLAEDFFLPLFAITIFLLFWPVISIWAIWGQYQSFMTEPYEPPKETPFEVKSEDLIEHYTIEEIEKMEVVTDPLNAAPKIPFGFLNAKWVEFKNKVQECNEVWSFSSLYKSQYGREYERNGYIIVKSDKPTQYFFECD